MKWLVNPNKDHHHQRGGHITRHNSPGNLQLRLGLGHRIRWVCCYGISWFVGKIWRTDCLMKEGSIESQEKNKPARFSTGWKLKGVSFKTCVEFMEVMAERNSETLLTSWVGHSPTSCRALSCFKYIPNGWISSIHSSPLPTSCQCYSFLGCLGPRREMLERHSRCWCGWKRIYQIVNEDIELQLYTRTYLNEFTCAT